MANPFYVPPGNDLSQGLNGLASTFSDIRKDRLDQQRVNLQQQQYDRQVQLDERQQKRFAEVQDAAQKAFESNDPDQVAKISLQYPEVGQMLQIATGLSDDMKKRDALDFTRQVATASPDQIPGLYERRIKTLQDLGRDPTHTIQSYEDYKANPEGERRNLNAFWAGIDPEGYKAHSAQQENDRKQYNEDRNYGLGVARLNQEASLAQLSSRDRALDRQISLMQAQQSAANNELHRQEIQMKIDTTKKEQDQNNLDMQNKAASAISTFDDTLAAINDVKNAPGLAGNFGKSSYFPNIRGSDASDAAAKLDVLRGKAFLTAFNSLKGGGAITEVEGKKATDALVAATNAQSVESFRKNLAIFENIVQRGRQEAYKQYGKYVAPGAGGIGGQSSSAGSSPSTPPVGTVQGGYRFKGGNPADQSNWEKQ